MILVVVEQFLLIALLEMINTKLVKQKFSSEHQSLSLHSKIYVSIITTIWFLVLRILSVRGRHINMNAEQELRQHTKHSKYFNNNVPPSFKNVTEITRTLHHILILE